MEESNMSNSATVSSRSRIMKLLDDNSFVEIGSYVTARSTDFNMKAQETPGDGVVTGYGTIEGILVYVYSQDSTVLGGAIGEMHAKKITAMYDMAERMGAPVIGLLDSAGLRLQEASDALGAFGSIYQAQAKASGVVPQITAVFGNCGGGLAVASAMSDFVFMEKDAKMFVNSPNALEGSDEAKLDNTTAEFQTEAGNVDFCGTNEEIFENIRDLISAIPSNNEEDTPCEDCEDDINRLTEELASCDDMEKMLEAISDDGFVLEPGKEYGKGMITAFIRLNGATVGCVANRESLVCPRGMRKAADFVTFCDAFNIPLLVLADVEGFSRKSAEAEKSIAKAAAKLTAAFAGADVPKVTLITRKAYGSAGVVMNSKAIGADIVYAWPEAEVGAMAADAAVKIIYADELQKEEKKAEFLKEKTEEYKKLAGSAEAAARRGYVDDIIKAEETRKRVIAAFEMLFSKSADRPSRKHGTI